MLDLQDNLTKRGSTGTAFHSELRIKNAFPVRLFAIVQLVIIRTNPTVDECKCLKKKKHKFPLPGKM